MTALLEYLDRFHRFYACTILVVNLKDFYTAPQQKPIILYQLFLEFIRLLQNIPQCFSVPIISDSGRILKLMEIIFI